MNEPAKTPLILPTAIQMTSQDARRLVDRDTLAKLPKRSRRFNIGEEIPPNMRILRILDTDRRSVKAEIVDIDIPIAVESVATT